MLIQQSNRRRKTLIIQKIDMLRRVKFILILPLLAILLSCSSPANHERKVQFGNKIYTESQVKEHLYQTYRATERIYIWNPVLEEVPYFLSVSDKLLSEENEGLFENQMKEFIALTGINFKRAKQDGNAYMVFSFATSIEELSEDPYTRAYYKNVLSSEKEYQDYWSRKEQNNSNHIKNLKIGTLDDFGDVHSLSAAFSGSAPYSPQNQSIYSPDEVSQNICQIMTGATGLTEIIKETCQKSSQKQPPYIWPFDKALIKFLYANPEISEMPLQNAIDVIFEHFFYVHGVK